MEQQLWDLVTSKQSVEVSVIFGAVKTRVFGFLKKKDGLYSVASPFGGASISFALENVRAIGKMENNTVISL